MCVCVQYRGDDDERESLKITFVGNLNEYYSTLLAGPAVPTAVA